eukprot:scaffold122707_cov20-Tisochrysis_lutea.AAC.2
MRSSSSNASTHSKDAYRQLCAGHCFPGGEDPKPKRKPGRPKKVPALAGQQEDREGADSSEEEDKERARVKREEEQKELGRWVGFLLPCSALCLAWGFQWVSAKKADEEQPLGRGAWSWGKRKSGRPKGFDELYVDSRHAHRGHLRGGEGEGA